jgi:predicted AlkP superfamily pyrophosphatase or phosphodiesterase
MIKYIFKILAIAAFVSINAQTTHINSLIKGENKNDRPKLVVGIVVDQMRYDYLYRFYEKYGDGGFKRLMNEGYNCENTHFNYVPTYTAVGHTSIYTGTTPSMHGIIGNDWYDKKLKRSVYCVDDNRFETVGAKKEGEKSPYRLQTTTVTDQLKLIVKDKGKVIGISLKDRAAILPVGHNADAAYWFRGKNDAKFITSSFYMEKLPKWVKKFNKSHIAKDLLKEWNTLYNINSYLESVEDNNDYERAFKGEKSPVFPHNYPELMKDNKGYDLLKASPFGNTLIERFAEATIIGEKLGSDKITDFLALSFSSTDYIGHMFGPDSKEIEDTYIRLDKDLERFLNFLDSNVGKGNYSLFLTADHGVSPIPYYLEEQKINAGYFEMKRFKNYLNEVTQKYFNSSELIANLSNYQIFLDMAKIEELGLDYAKVTKVLKNKAILFDGIYKTVTAETLQIASFNDIVLSAVQRGYNQKFSGDVIVVPMPAVLYKKMKGTSHGTAYSYDTHVPLLFFGKGFRNGHSTKYIPIVDIAPTIANLLKIEFPSACSGSIIEMK